MRAKLIALFCSPFPAPDPFIKRIQKDAKEYQVITTIHTRIYRRQTTRKNANLTRATLIICGVGVGRAKQLARFLR